MRIPLLSLYLAGSRPLACRSLLLVSDYPTADPVSHKVAVMTPISIAIALLACSLLIAFAYVAVDEHV